MTGQMIQHTCPNITAHLQIPIQTNPSSAIPEVILETQIPENSMKSSCKWGQKMSEHNKVYFNSRNDAINQGYIPCKVCNP